MPRTLHKAGGAKESISNVNETTPSPKSSQTARKSVHARKPSTPTRKSPGTLFKKTKKTAEVPPATPSKKRRFHPGTRALMEIRKFQKSTDLLLRKLPFARLVCINNIDHVFVLIFLFFFSSDSKNAFSIEMQKVFVSLTSYSHRSIVTLTYCLFLCFCKNSISS